MVNSSLIAELEELVHKHIAVVDLAKKALRKAKRSGDTSSLDDRAQKLIEISTRLESILTSIDRDFSSLARDPDSRERLELLLFFLQEVSLREESDFWKSLSKLRSKGLMKESAAIELAEAMAGKSERLRRQALDLLEKVKS